MSCNNTADFKPAKQNVQIWRDDTWSETFKLTINNITPIDLTGATINIQVRTSAESPQVALSLSTTTSTITITGDDHNEINLNKKVDIPAGNYVYDMKVTFPNTNSRTYIWGTFYVQENITKI